jgi:para-nitrobenzyl esterase
MGRRPSQPPASARAKRIATDALVLALAGTSAACGSGDRGAEACAGVGKDGLVRVEAGLLQGHTSSAACAFTGVPYAAAPLSELRFSEAKPAAPWKGVRDARTRTPWCPQLASDGAPVGDEDCLYLNVWTTASETALRPILVFVHGGGNVTGSSAEPVYDGAHLAERSAAVVVTLDYRLGPFGYLAHPSLGQHSGNYGLSDQSLALDWVKKNGAAFGGDPARVLAFGQSAGSRNLCTLLAASTGELPFRAVALESGACEIQPESDALSFGAEFAEAAGCADAADVASCLRALSTAKVLSALPDQPDPLYTSHYNPNDAVTSGRPPLERLRENSSRDALPVIVGANAEETGHIAQPLGSASEYGALLRITFGDEIAARILSLYPASDFESPRDAWNAVITDFRYVCPSEVTAKALSANAARSVHRYLFAHGLDRGPRRAWGAFHGLELLFLFGTFDALGYDPSPEEEDLSDRMMAYWTRFADTGDPNDPEAPSWPAYDPMTERYLDIDAEPRAAEKLHREHCDFWQSLAP